MADWRPSKATTKIFVFFLLSPYSSPPNDTSTPSPLHAAQHASPLSSPLTLPPTFGWLLCLLTKRRPPKAKPRPPLCFSVKVTKPSQTSKPTTASTTPTAHGLCMTVERIGAKSWGRCWPTHGGRGPKLLEGWAAAGGCAVGCVHTTFCFLCC